MLKRKMRVLKKISRYVSFSSDWLILYNIRDKEKKTKKRRRRRRKEGKKNEKMLNRKVVYTNIKFRLFNV